MENSKLRLTPFIVARKQTYFEFFYLVILFFIGSGLLFCIYCDYLTLPVHFKRQYAYAALGAFLGGWCFDVKWFYRAVAYSKDIKESESKDHNEASTEQSKKNKYESQGIFHWEFNRFYWRLLSPYLSMAVGFGTYSIVLSDLIPFIDIKCHSGISAFGFSFIFGYFSDFAIGKMADWSHDLLEEGKRK